MASITPIDMIPFFIFYNLNDFVGKITHFLENTKNIIDIIWQLVDFYSSFFDKKTNC